MKASFWDRFVLTLDAIFIWDAVKTYSAAPSDDWKATFWLIFWIAGFAWQWKKISEEGRQYVDKHST